MLVALAASASVALLPASADAGHGGTQQYRQAVLQLGPTAYLRFDGDYRDSSRSGAYPAAPAGGVRFGAGAPVTRNRNNRAASFDGATGVVTLPGTAGLSFTRSATLAAWVRFNRLPSESGQPFPKTIVAKSGVAHDLDLQAEDDDRFYFYVGVGTPNRVASRTIIVAGRWYFVAAVYRPGTMEMYINGFLEGFRDDAGVTRDENTTDIAIGGNPYWGQFGQNRSVDGRIDEVAVFTTALTAGQLVDLYRSAASN